MDNKSQSPEKNLNKDFKLLIFVGYFYPRIGGVELVVLKLIRDLAKKGFKDISIITKKHDENLPDFEIVEGAKVYRISSSKNQLISLFQKWKWVFKHRNLILNSDLLQFHDQSTFLWHLPLLFYKKPKFMIFHGPELAQPVKLRYKILRGIVSRMVGDYACVGRYMEKYYPVPSRNVFYNGIDEIPPKTKKTKEICFVARIQEDTQLMSYLKSLVYLKEKYGLNLNLDVYGDGHLRKQCEDFAKQNKLNVEFKGWTTDAGRFVRHYKYTFATQYLTTLDAMASQSLVFTIAVNNLRKDIADDFLQEGKYGIICEDYKELAEKFYYYYKNKKEAEEIVNRAFDYSKSFLWSKVIDDTFISSYNRLLKR